MRGTKKVCKFTKKLISMYRSYRLFQRDVRRDTSGRDKTNVKAVSFIRWKKIVGLVFFQFVWICDLSKKKTTTKPMSKILNSLFNLASQTEAKAFKNYILHLLTHFIHAAFCVNLYNGFMDSLLKIVSRWLLLYSTSYFPVLEHSVFADMICQFSNNGTWFSPWDCILASTPIHWLRRR